jgi:hypothetical protein
MIIDFLRTPCLLRGFILGCLHIVLINMPSKRLITIANK